MRGGQRRDARAAVEQMSTREAVQLATKIQADSKKSTERSKQIVEETLNVYASPGVGARRPVPRTV